MKHSLIASVTSKVAIGVAATALAAGTAGAVIATQPVSDSHDAVTVEETTTTTSTTSTTSTTVDPATTSTTSTTVADDDAAKTAVTDDSEHPDNFGAIVSKDAKDGGVDGHEISKMAHDRNDARATQHEADSDDDDSATVTDDHGDDHGGERGQSADHATDDDQD